MGRFRKLLLALVLAAALPMLSLTSAEAMTNGERQNSAPSWMALITYNGHMQCSGALVGDGWVLTAAHCLAAAGSSVVVGPNGFHVVIGRSNINKTDEGVEYAVDITLNRYPSGLDIIPGYYDDHFHAYDSRNDAALIRLKNFDHDRWHALPMAFEPKVVYRTDGVTVYGYGGTEWTGQTTVGKAGQLWKSPNGAFMQLRDDRCMSQILCFHHTGPTEAMHGDSGSSILRWNSGAWQIVGVLDWVIDMGRDGKNDPLLATATLATLPNGKTTFLNWVRDVAGLPVPPAKTIVRNQRTGASWLVGEDHYRHWIPTGGDYQCYVGQGSKVVNLPQISIDTVPDRVGDHAKCTPGVPQPDPTTSAGAIPTADPGTQPTFAPTTGPQPSPTSPPSKRATPIHSFGKIDFDHDGYSDFVIYAGGQWAVKSGKGPHDYIAQGVSLGGSSDLPFVGDFNGDGTPDFAIYSGGQWAVRSGVAPYNYVAQGIQLGGPGSTPVIGDFNHDGVADFGIYSGGQWAVKSGKAPYDYVAQGIWLGNENSVPVVGDFNGDGYSDFGIYDNGTWAVRSGQSPYNYVSQGIQLGSSGSKPLVGDVNGDGRSDYVIYSGGTWAIKSGVAPYDYVAQGVSLGNSSSVPLLGDFNNDGRADYTIWDGGTWAAKSSVDPNPYSAQGVQLGSPGQVPLTG